MQGQRCFQQSPQFRAVDVLDRAQLDVPHPLARALNQARWIFDERSVGQLQVHVRAVRCDAGP